MTQSSAEDAQGLAGAPRARRGQLALALQEPLTAIVRLRANRQMAADAESFRRHMKGVLGIADQEARRAGYAEEDVRLALYAAVAFLDESVLNSTQPMFADWPRKTLQDELYGGHLGGELFFQQLQYLLAKPDSDDLADVLEVYELCMMLGFHGRYSASESGELQMLIGRVGDKIRRIRGPERELSPAWAPPAETIAAVGRDRWTRRIAVAAALVLVVAVALLIVFRMQLDGGIASLQALAPRVAR
jgi:type VI secretion system protein ImpK